jgi:hypothetical protein
MRTKENNLPLEVEREECRGNARPSASSGSKCSTTSEHSGASHCSANPRQKPTVPEVLPMMYAYRDTAGNGVGGSLHIVLDDGNVEDGHVRWCIERAQECGDEEGVKLGETLLSMTKTQRKKLSAMFYGPTP